MNGELIVSSGNIRSKYNVNNIKDGLSIVEMVNSKPDVYLIPSKQETSIIFNNIIPTKLPLGSKINSVETNADIINIKIEKKDLLTVRGYLNQTIKYSTQGSSTKNIIKSRIEFLEFINVFTSDINRIAITIVNVQTIGNKLTSDNKVYTSIKVWFNISYDITTTLSKSEIKNLDNNIVCFDTQASEESEEKEFENFFYLPSPSIVEYVDTEIQITNFSYIGDGYYIQVDGIISPIVKYDSFLCNEGTDGIWNELSIEEHFTEVYEVSTGNISDVKAEVIRTSYFSREDEVLTVTSNIKFIFVTS